MEKLTEVLAPKLSEAVNMGGYAAYVWPSFAVAVCVILFMTIASLRGLRKARRTLADLQNSLSSTEPLHET